MKRSRVSLGGALLSILLLMQPGPAIAASDRHAFFVSDLHVGVGRDEAGNWKRFEDFRWQQDFNAFLEMASERSGDRADLVLVGDIFELWQSPHLECSSDLGRAGCKPADCHDKNTDLGCSEVEAVERLRLVLAQHPDFIDAVRRFSVKGSNRVVFVPGNHDAALLFPAVKKLLLGRFEQARVRVADVGYWLSDDGEIYADHGHQFDEVNKFPDWPRPFRHSAGRDHLVRPWGENMVQQFYNQYESVFPIIDNLSDEKAGVGFAVQQAGFPNSAAAVRRFFRFFLFQQSLRQAMTSLGPEGSRQWNYDAVRREGVDFFMDVMAGDDEWRLPVENLRPGPVDGFAPAELSQTEIDALCMAKEQIEGARRCRHVSDSLSAVFIGLTTTPRQRLAAYLRSTLPDVVPPGLPVASVYVFGHTHAAALPSLIALGDMQFGSVDVVAANTGAFQRIATPDQIAAILRKPGQGGKRPLDLHPEDLPACYTFVWIAPYAAQHRPTPQVQRWTRTKTILTAQEGTCDSVE